MSLIVALTSLTPLIAPNSWKIWLYCNYVTLLYRLGRGGEGKGGVSLPVWSTDVGVCSALPPSSRSLLPERRARPAFYWNSATIIVFSRNGRGRNRTEKSEGEHAGFEPLPSYLIETTSTSA